MVDKLLNDPRDHLYHIEVTDTFAGQANYGWVKRREVRVRTKRQLIKAVRELAGWTGKVRTELWGDALCLRPDGLFQIAFASYGEP